MEGERERYRLARSGREKQGGMEVRCWDGGMNGWRKHGGSE